jgi:hypothetical protein
MWKQRMGLNFFLKEAVVMFCGPKQELLFSIAALALVETECRYG